MARLGGPGITNFAVIIEPKVQGADQASAQLNRLVDKGVKAVEAGNLELAQKYEQALAQITGKKGKAEIQVDVDTVVDKDGVKHLKQVSRIHTENISKLAKQKALHQGSLTSLRAQLRTATQNRDAIKATTTQTGLFGRKVTVMNGEWKTANAEVKRIGEEINKISNVGGGKGIFSGIASLGNKAGQMMNVVMLAVQAMQAIQQIAGAFVNRQKEIQALKLSFDQLGVGVEGQAAIMQSAKAVSLTYGQSLTKIEGAFKRLGPAIMAAGGSLTDTQLVIETIAARTTMLGLNTEKTGRYIEAFAQVMGKGRLQGEELNQQFAELDGALRGQLAAYFEASHGITDLAKAMQDGEITSQMFMEAMISIGEVARNRVASDFSLLNSKIKTLGKEGGMTIAQFQAKMQTLTAIGIEKIGQTLAPFGRHLAQIQAAFVQIFTKIATEMPGIQKLFTFLADVIGKSLKTAINGILLLFGVLMDMLDKVLVQLDRFIDYVMKLPVIGNILKGMAGWSKSVDEDLEYAIDGFSMLDEATTGTLDALKKFEEQAADLKQQLADKAITTEQYSRALNKINTDKAKAALKGLGAEAEATKAKLEAMLEAYEAASEAKVEGWEDDIKAIEETGEAEKKVTEERIEGIKRAAEIRKQGYEDAKRAAKAYYDAEQADLDNQARNLKRNKELLRRGYEDAKNSIKQYYDEARKKEENNHASTIKNIDDQITKLKEKQAAALAALQSGPQQEKLAQMEIQKLRRQASQETNQYERQKILAQIEQLENEKKANELKKKHADELAQAEQKKAEEEKRHAEEKKKLDEEERAKLKQIQDEQRQAFRDIADALTIIADKKKKSQEEEKAAIDAINNKKREDERKTKEEIQNINDKYKQGHENRKNQIEEIKGKIEEEKNKLEEVTRGIEENERAMGEFGSAVQNVTMNELQAQLEKLQTIKRQIDENKRAMQSSGGSGGGGTPPAQAFAGGSVRGGELRTVNELGREGFITSSGRMQEIATKAWGTWRAPSSGTIIPAHIWSEIKAAQSVDPASINVGSFSGGSSVSSISHGDSIMNNVTVQSVNPAKTASDMLVSMTKIRRRRLR